MREGLTRRLPQLLVVALFCVPLFVGLGRTDLGNDESIYSFAVDRILETGDWLTPKSSPDENAPFLEKPPLKFWIVAAPIRAGLLPHDEFGLRFWDALFGAAAFLYVYLIGRRLGGPICGAAAAAVLFVHSPLLFEHGLRSNNMEAPLVLAYCGGVRHFLDWTRSGDRVSALAVALFFVLGFMTKFVAALFLPLVLLMAAAVVPAWRREMLRAWRVWLSLGALAVALIAPWFVYEHVRFGSMFWEIMFGEHVLRRMTVSIDPGHLHPFGYYFQQMYAVLLKTETLPLVAAGAVLLAIGALRRRGEHVLVALWAVVPLVLISVSPSKIYHYAYPFLPAVALTAGLVPAELWRFGQPRLRQAGAILDAWSATRARTIVAIARRRPVSILLLVVSAAALVLATLAAAGVPVRWRLAPGVVLRNSSAIRPWLVAFVLTALAARSSYMLRLLIPLLILAIMPVAAYQSILGRLTAENHPLRDARDCVLRVIGQGPLPGVYAQITEGSFVHSYYYYLRRFGPWEWIPEPDDAALYDNLLTPAARRPVLASDQRYSDFRKYLRTRGYAAADLSEPMVNLGTVLLVLPGRYSSCSADARAQVQR